MCDEQIKIDLDDTDHLVLLALILLDFWNNNVDCASDITITPEQKSLLQNWLYWLDCQFDAIEGINTSPDLSFDEFSKLY